MSADSPGKGLFGVRGFGLYERWTSLWGETTDEPASSSHAPLFPASCPGILPSVGGLLGAAGAGAVQVVARCRPRLRARDPCCELEAEDSGSAGVRLRFSAPEVGLHEVFCSAYLGPSSTQEALFEHAAHIVERTVDGCNGLVLCCGTSNSGKTYTMMGPPAEIRPQESLPSDGIIPRAARLIFERMQHMDEVFVVEASFLDICPAEGGGPDQLVDLLSDKVGTRLQVMQDPLKPGVFVCEGLSRTPIRKHEKVAELLKAGLKRRESLEAAFRGRPRCAHCVFTVSLEGLTVLEGSIEPVVKRGKLIFAEFAGLPSPGLARGSAGLGGQRCLSLELLLRECVRGDSPVLLVANFSPELQRASESVRTLALAQNVLLGMEGTAEEAAGEASVAPGNPPPLGQERGEEEEEEEEGATADASLGTLPVEVATAPAAAQPSPAGNAPPSPERPRRLLAQQVAGHPLARTVPGAARVSPPSPTGPSLGSLGVRARTGYTPPSRAAEDTPSPQSGTECQQPQQEVKLRTYVPDAQLQMRAEASTARQAELEEHLREVTACKRAVDMEVAQLKVKLASTEERVRLLAEHHDELNRERADIQEERRSLRTKTDMQQQKLIMFEEELERFKGEALEKREAVQEQADMLMQEAASHRQEGEAWRAQEADLQQKAARLRRELDEFKRKASVDKLRQETKGDEARSQLRLQIQRMQEEAVAETTALAQARQRQSAMEAEQLVLEQREEALKQEGMRKLLTRKQELEEAKVREAELQNMLAELQEGLLTAEEGMLEELDDAQRAVVGA